MKSNDKKIKFQKREPALEYVSEKNLANSKNFLGLPAICSMTDLSRSTIYRLIADGDFPKPVRISKGRVAWRERDLTAWLESRGGRIA